MYKPGDTELKKVDYSELERVRKKNLLKMVYFLLSMVKLYAKPEYSII